MSGYKHRGIELAQFFQGHEPLVRQRFVQAESISCDQDVNLTVRLSHGNRPAEQVLSGPAIRAFSRPVGSHLFPDAKRQRVGRLLVPAA